MIFVKEFISIRWTVLEWLYNIHLKILNSSIKFQSNSSFIFPKILVHHISTQGQLFLPNFKLKKFRISTWNLPFFLNRTRPLLYLILKCLLVWFNQSQVSLFIEKIITIFPSTISPLFLCHVYDRINRITIVMKWFLFSKFVIIIIKMILIFFLQFLTKDIWFYNYHFSGKKHYLI